MFVAERVVFKILGGFDDSDLSLNKSNSVFNCIFYEHITVVNWKRFDVDGLCCSFFNHLCYTWIIFVNDSTVFVGKVVFSPFSLCGTLYTSYYFL